MRKDNILNLNTTPGSLAILNTKGTCIGTDVSVSLVSHEIGWDLRDLIQEKTHQKLAFQVCLLTYHNLKNIRNKSPQSCFF